MEIAVSGDQAKLVGQSRVNAAALLLLMAYSMVGEVLHEWLGIGMFVLSCHALSFLPISGGSFWARTLHMLSAYWGFVFISLHLGLLIAGYGSFAFIKREIGSYMLLKIHFVFFDFDEPLILFLLVYDKTGNGHLGIIEFPVPILKGNVDVIKAIREKLYEPEFSELTVVDFSELAQGCKTVAMVLFHMRRSVISTGRPGGLIAEITWKAGESKVICK